MASIETPSRKRKQSTNAKPKKSKSKLAAIECPICLSPTKPSRMIKLSRCSCQYCQSCLREAFDVGLTASNFPARCCGFPLNLDDHEKQLKPPALRAYRSKIEEHENNNPFYCAKPDCGEYLLESTYRDKFATCGMCHKKTCTECKMLKGDHLGIHSMCPQDTDELWELSEKKGWRRCPRCFCLVEKVSGCDEIRCRCKAYFCYSCGKLTEASTRVNTERCVCRVPTVIDTPAQEEARHTEIIIESDDELPDMRDLLQSRRQSLLPAEFPD